MKGKMLGKRKQQGFYVWKKALVGGPQKRGTCLRVFVEKPKKPNSSRRKLTKLLLCTRRKTKAHIMGDDKGVMPLQKHSTVLISGLRPQDMPAVKYRTIRGVMDTR